MVLTEGSEGGDQLSFSKNINRLVSGKQAKIFAPSFDREQQWSQVQKFPKHS